MHWLSFYIFVFFIGEKVFLQHVLLSVGTFIYGVPIPLAYLLNETRVRNTIIDKGWIEGFKSIFYSNEKIKQLKRKRIVSFLHPEGVPKYCKPFRLNYSQNEVTKTLRRLMTKKDNSSISLNHCCDNKVDDYSSLLDSKPYNPIRKQYNEFENSKENVNPEDHHNEDVIVTVHCSLEPNAINTDNSKKKAHGCLHSSYNKSKNYIGDNYSQEDDIIPVSSEEHTEAITDAENLMFVDISLIKSTFPQTFENIFKILREEGFQAFSRTYILNHILHCLNEESASNESNYLKHFQYLCSLDKYPERQNNSEKNLNLIISLINAWHLSKKNSTNHNSKFLKFNEADVSVKPSSSKQVLERKRLIELLLFNVSVETQYAKLLEELYQLEDTRDEEEFVSYW